MDFSGLLLLAFLWFIFNLLGRSRSAPQQGRRPLPRDPLRPSAAPERGDPTQREGSRLESLLREFERALGEAGGAASGRSVPRRSLPDRSPSSPLPSAEEVEERESLEEEPAVVSLEVDRPRPVRVAVSQDDGVERLVVGRIEKAQARSGELTRADHLAFDRRIRQEPADATAVRGLSPEELRRAVVWREVLGPPVSLRRDD